MAIGFAVAFACASLKVQLSICSLVWSFAYFMLVWWGLSNPQKLLWLKSAVARPFLFLGLISYSLYLFHSPFFYLFGTMWVALVGAKPASYLLAILFAFLSIIPAYLGYRFVEAPSHSLGRALAAWLENKGSTA
jgi:peptidoglycan/LPS O-acetylase OafA/YrhL